MSEPKENLGVSTVEEVEQQMASLLADAQGQLLNDAEMQRFALLQEEIEWLEPMRPLPSSFSEPPPTPPAANPALRGPVLHVAHNIS
jgi:hypothetical protein